MKSMNQIIRALLCALCLCLGMAYAQAQVAVTGTVVDEYGEPLPGAAIVCVDAPRLSATTDANGRFTLSVPQGAQLRVSFMGYLTQTLTARPQLDIQLKPGALQLDAVEVVAIGYGAVKKKDLTGAVASVSGETIRRGNIPTLNAALQGLVAADIGADWKPGASPAIEIRGISSITGSNDPLWVVDGIPMNSSSVNLNPNDVLDIAVLKDASAAAIYGARGSNGVIIVTTKHAATGESKITVDYSGWVGIEQVTRRPNLLGGEAYADFKRRAWTNGGKDLSTVFDAVELASLSEGRATDWFDEVWGGTAVSTNHHVSFNASGPRTGTMISIGYLDQTSLIDRAGFERYNLKFDNVFKFSDRLKLTTTLLGSYTKSDNYPGTVQFVYQLSPLGTPRDENGNLKLYANPNETVITNPLMDVQNSENTDRTYGFIGTSALEWNIWDGLSYKFSVGIDLATPDNGNYSGSDTYARAGKPAEAEYSSKRELSTTIDNVLTWQKTIGEAHRINLMAGFNMEHAQNSSVKVKGTDMYYDSSYWNLNAAVNVLDKETKLSEWGIMSWMGRANYSLLDRYLVTLTVRYDGSSRLAEAHRWSAFPSASVAWRLSEEPFLAGARAQFLDNLKLRLSWGNTGNTNVPAYGTLGELSKTYYTFGGDPAIGTIPSVIPNPSLKWERTEEYNLGIDFGLFNTRLSGTIDVYQRTTKDLILDRKLPATGGYKSVRQNIGSTRNRGLELTLNGDVLRTRDFTWNMGITFFTNKNEIIDLYGDKADDTGSSWFIGYPIRVNYALDFIGVWQENEPEAANYGAKPGDPKYRDVTNPAGLTRIEYEDRVIISKEPAWIGSLNTSVRYKWFDLYVAVSIRQGEKEMAGALSAGAGDPGRYNMPEAEYWTPENRSNTDPAPWMSKDTRTYSVLGSSDYYIRDVSFVRISTISLGYTFPAALVQKIRAQHAKVYININNPFVFTPYPGQDPQALGTGYPAVTAFQLGLNLNF
jgi:TonB-linked SusC/RagA family outer membrane protein